MKLGKCTFSHFRVNRTSKLQESSTKHVSDPNILPVVDLTKAEMEIFTVEDFKDQKLDHFRRKTNQEKSTVLVVCIDHGMCAAFHLPQDSVQENASSVVQSAERQYLSVKKSLDKAFPSLANTASNQSSGTRSAGNNDTTVEEDAAIRNIPV